MYLFSGSGSQEQRVQKLEADVNLLRTEVDELKKALLTQQSQGERSKPPIGGQTFSVLAVPQLQPCSASVGAPVWHGTKAAPVLPGTPLSKARFDDPFDSVSLYSQATTTASQPAAYVDKAKARKAGAAPGWAGWQGAQSEAHTGVRSPLLADGLLDRDQLAQVKETVGEDITPWLHVFLSTTHTPVVPPTDPTHESDHASTARDTHPADVRRQSRDQVSDDPQGLGQLSLAAPQAASTAGPIDEGSAAEDLGLPEDGSPQVLLAGVALLAACEADEDARVQLCEGGALPVVVALLEGSRGGSKTRRVAANLLWYMSRSAAAIGALSSVGAGHLGKLLVHMLACRERDDVQTTRACALALNNFAAQCDAVRAAAAECNVVSVLAELLTSGDNVGAEAAAAALLGLTCDTDNTDSDNMDNDNKAIAEGCEDAEGAEEGEGEGRTEGAVCPGAEAVCVQLAQSQVAMEACLKMLRYSDPATQENLAGVMQNVTSFLAGNTELIVALITRSQCIPALLEVSRCSSAACQESALSALGNLATDEDTCHTALALAAARVQASAMLCLRNLCTGRLATKTAVVTRGGAAACLAAAQSAAGAWAAPDECQDSSGALTATQQEGGEVCDAEDVCEGEWEEHTADYQSWALHALLSLSSEPSLREPLVHRYRAAPPLLSVMLSGAPDAKEVAAKVLTNLAVPDTCKAALAEQGALMVLVPAVRTGTITGRQAACKALYNLAKRSANRWEIAACGGVSSLLSVIEEGPGGVFDAACSTLYAICNHMQVMDQLVSVGGPKVLLSVVRRGHFTNASRGTRLLLRLLHRASLLYPAVHTEVASEAAALGLFM